MFSFLVAGIGAVFAVATAVFGGSRAGQDRGSWIPGVLPLLAFVFLRSADVPDNPLRTSLWGAGILLLIGTAAGVTLSPRLRARAPQRLVLLFVSIYILSFFYSHFIGVSLRTASASAALMSTSVLVGAAMSIEDFRKTVQVVLCVGGLAIAGGLLMPSELVIGLPVTLEVEPLDLANPARDRRFGFVAPLAADAAMLGVGLLCSGFVTTRMTSRLVGITSRLIIRLVLLAIPFGYLLMSQFRYVVASTVATFVVSILIARKKVVPGFLVAVAATTVLAWALANDTEFLGRGETSVAYQSRTELFERSWHVFKESPILGSGLGSNGALMASLGLVYENAAGDLLSGAHSGHLIVLIETGIVGLVLWVLMWRRTYRRNSLSWTSTEIRDLSTNWLFRWDRMPVLVATYLVTAQFFHGILFEPWVWMLLAFDISIPLRSQPKPRNILQPRAVGQLCP